MIDAHQHFWSISRGDYGWLTPEQGAIYRDFLPHDLAPHLAAADITQTVLVQAAPTVAETNYLLELAAGTPYVAGVVGWVDFEAPDVADVIRRLARNRYLVGLRPMIQDLDDPEWMLRDTLQAAIEVMIDLGLVFDALVLPAHLPVLRRFINRYPRLPIVIDHAAKPQIETGVIDGWIEELAAVAQAERVTCKLSGLVTEAGQSWSNTTLRPYVNALVRLFGTERLLWGSDWPVCTSVASYAQWFEAATTLLAGLSENERRAVFGANAARVYGLN